MSTRLVGLLAAFSLLAACSSSPQPTFHLVAATVDATYQCPDGSTDAPYSVHASIVVHNDTSSQVTIDSASATFVLAAVSGTWLEPVGSRYDASPVDVSPTTIAARAGATLALSIPSACTSAPKGSGSPSSGAYEVTLKLVTSAGTFSIKSANKHEIHAS